MALDMKKLVMIMRMTESDSDGEALNALRHANRLLKEDGKNWQDVIGFASKPALGLSPDYRQPPSKRGTGDTSRYGRPASQKRADSGRKVTDPSIDGILSALGQRKHEVSTLMFLASVRDFWERNGFLTEPQFEALKAMHAHRPGGTSSGGARNERWRF